MNKEMVASNQKQRFRAGEFAALAGVTVRALHHYDRLGLLKPSRTHNGYRTYGHEDLERLEQIVALKFIGLPLRRIKGLLDRGRVGLRDALTMQRRVLEARRGLLEQTIDAIRQAESAVAQGNRPEAAILKKIIEVIEMQNDSEWMMKYYNESAKEKIAERRAIWSPELQERVSRQWIELIREVEESVAEDPGGPKGQELAARWTSLIEEFTGGDTDVLNGLRRLYSDRENWPAAAKHQIQPFQIKPEAREFINQAIAIRKQRA